MRVADLVTTPNHRALAHQCPSCRRHWALRLVDHPAGLVALCRYCGSVRGAVPTRATSDGNDRSA